MTDAEKKALLEQHEQRARDRERYSNLNLLRAKQASDALRRLKGEE